MTGVILKVLEGFHHQVDRQIAVMMDRHTEYGEWEYPPVADALEDAGIFPIKEYIKIWKATITSQVAFRTIYELCAGVEQMPGSICLTRWWNQDVGPEEE